MRTVGSALQQYNGKAPGADVVRLSLATAVLVYHTIPITTGTYPNEIVGMIGMKVLVPGFMALSGFLLAASAQRSDLGTFIGNRMLRIFPGLIAVVLACALVLGPIVTTVPLGDYFRSREFFRYLLGAVGWPSYSLPGVFLDHPYVGNVNASLWSIPVELECYVAMATLLALGLVRNRFVVLAVALATHALTLIPFMMAGTHGVHFHVSLFLSQFVYFITGSALWMFRSSVPLRASLFWVSVALVVGLMLAQIHFLVLPLAAAYAVVFAACTPLRLPFRGDYSYGVYLYAAPIQQVALFFTPAIWWLNLVVALPLALLAAMMSWHFVEKPALDLKRRKGKRGRGSPGTEVGRAAASDLPVEAAPLASGTTRVSS